MLPAGSDGGPLRGFKDAQREAAFLRRFSADCAGSDCVVLLVGELLHCLATAKMAASGAWLGAAAMLPHIAFVLGAAALARRTPHAYVSHRSALLGAVQLAFVLTGWVQAPALFALTAVPFGTLAL
ncbi:MFS transporter [Micractinium conductrix]|uniref:MFS transporter n=1 Tax=Micractinium conductrix TaxID=554055 RepID=A0A2P6VMZ4_9CHLO|nr:MFS transporter [Micractinium conductrix]|eukprot:PSC75464.1 MFS transporter [Micractinium conductrix]